MNKIKKVLWKAYYWYVVYALWWCYGDIVMYYRAEEEFFERMKEALKDE